ncbi:MAG: hypothetical protein F4Y12_12935 [Acidimicrobiaceae bacterium]|nr:hypothetical protein [Gemmatimonadota bacterium]MYA86474.1 hypothetical protein [Acidimicrobiaceae bacterium]MYH78220.1 hypothetical protein [Acidimicrobiaceae bacterium]MYK76123.1 hypothetical protein [Acidimicrobiaceae bacterium]
MEKEANGDLEKLGGLSWPSRVVLGGLAVVGAITMVQRVLAIVSWLVTLLMIFVVIAALLVWLVSERRRR